MIAVASLVVEHIPVAVEHSLGEVGHSPEAGVHSPGVGVHSPEGAGCRRTRAAQGVGPDRLGEGSTLGEVPPFCLVETCG